MDVNKLLQIGRLKKCSADEIVFYENDQGDEMYLVLQGSVGVYKHNLDGSRIELAVLSAGDFFGEMSLVDNQPRSADVQALEDVTLFVIDNENLEKVVATCPDLAVKIMKGMSLRIRKLNDSYRELWDTAKSLEEESLEVDSTEQRIAQKMEMLKQNQGYLQAKEELAASAKETISKEIDYERIYASKMDTEYLIKSTVECPVCEQNFETDRIRNTLLKQAGEDCDFRVRYKDFEPYWYNIWVCPHCFYGNFDHAFTKAHYLKKKEIAGQKYQMQSKYSVLKSGTLTLKQVIAKFFLCQDIFNMIPKERLPFAKVWLYLSWIYEDAGDTEMFQFANQMALDAYIDFYSNDTVQLAQGQEIRLCMLIAELFKKQGKIDEAVKYLYKAVQMRTEPKREREQASERLMEYKNLKE
ncbi:DUF2225 domain-containing protein [Desulfuribacillus alkaliarsenatis]|uniref:Cyclic nucleotide-binding domain-containing protein n=1 Tax=Desulfuribacillus alkaliarsenatis TaxID=766136 RepID=A0A1E5G4A8_9FIRM|nr:DUF2225 domain-containing protein [Desulfuribacillus alkaliarsenatis]OEF97499.1 hypothetical protein BHF68_04650 [Desulfuribacillus alkaliarsenatis]